MSTTGQDDMDFRRYDRVWQRVAPTLAPWPDGAASLDGGAVPAGVGLSKGGAVPAGAVVIRGGRILSDTRRGGAVSVVGTGAASGNGNAEPAASLDCVASPPQSADGAGNAVQTLDCAPVPPAAENTPASVQSAETAASAQSAQTAETAGSVSLANLPGAEPDPCCMGTEAAEDLEVLAGFTEDALMEQRYLTALARQAPLWARQCLRESASHCAARARRLMAVYYLITGTRYVPAVCLERIYVGKWLPALRERYHAAACGGLNFQRAADGTPDPCLGKLLEELGTESFRDAAELLRLLERALGTCE